MVRNVFRYLQTDDYTDCIPIEQLRQPTDEDTLEAEDDEDFLEFFLNFHFSKHPNSDWKPTINGIQNAKPVSPLQVQEFIFNIIDLKIYTSRVAENINTKI